MLYDVFCTAIKMSITASVTGVIVLSLKALLQKMKFSRSVLMILYLLIAFRLICPCVPQSSFSVFNLANSSVNREEVIAGQNFSAKQIYYGDNSKTASAQKGSDTAPALKSFNTEELVSVIWLSGAAIMLGYLVISYTKLKRLLRFSVKYCRGVYLSEHISASFVLGLIKPRIYVPVTFSQTHRENMIAHEKMHIKRLDHISKIAAWVILSFHWFNPCVWLMFRLFSADVEFACDEAVIKSGVSKESYLNSLFQAALQGKSERLPQAVCSFASSTRLRVKNLANYKKLSCFARGISLLVCIFLCLVFGTNALNLKSTQHVIARINPPETDIEMPVEDDMAVLPVEKAEPLMHTEDTAVCKPSGTEIFYKTNYVADELYIGYEKLEYEDISIEKLEASLVNSGYQNISENADLTENYTRKSFNTAEESVCSGVKCDKNGNISLYVNLNTDCHINVEIYNGQTGQMADGGGIVANGRNVYSFLGFEPDTDYNIILKSSVGNEWKIYGEYIIY